jgi:hypothetical protein
LAFVLAVTGLLNGVAVQWILCFGLSNSIMLRTFHVVLKLIHVKVHFSSLEYWKGLSILTGFRGCIIGDLSCSQPCVVVSLLFAKLSSCVGLVTGW